MALASNACQCRAIDKGLRFTHPKHEQTMLAISLQNPAAREREFSIEAISEPEKWVAGVDRREPPAAKSLGARRHSTAATPYRIQVSKQLLPNQSPPHHQPSSTAAQTSAQRKATMSADYISLHLTASSTQHSFHQHTRESNPTTDHGPPTTDHCAPPPSTDGRSAHNACHFRALFFQTRGHQHLPKLSSTRLYFLCFLAPSVAAKTMFAPPPQRKSINVCIDFFITQQSTHEKNSSGHSPHSYIQTSNSHPSPNYLHPRLVQHHIADTIELMAPNTCPTSIHSASSPRNSAQSN